MARRDRDRDEPQSAILVPEPAKAVQPSRPEPALARAAAVAKPQPKQPLPVQTVTDPKVVASGSVAARANSQIPAYEQAGAHPAGMVKTYDPDHDGWDTARLGPEPVRPAIVVPAPSVPAQPVSPSPNTQNPTPDKQDAGPQTTNTNRPLQRSEPDPRDDKMHCKPRPKDNTPKGGGGSGKSFVPWEGTKFGC